MHKLRFRQIHLDFHTSEHIPTPGDLFDTQQFQEALKIGHVNSITLFAKCHHSWSYYPTNVGKTHPALTFDLLGQQIEACHEIGVRAPIYYTVGWSANDAERHQGWCVRAKAGSILANRFDFEAQADDHRPTASWKFLCPSGGYLDLILKQTREICECYPVDGFFYDITNGPLCYCENCRRGMEKEGIDPDNLAAVTDYSDRRWKHMLNECLTLIHSYHPEATFFCNGTTHLYDDGVTRESISSDVYTYDTHYELEDLPTTWGGYDKFPLRAKFFHNTGKPILAMSGKFHTFWGEFGGFKHPDALWYEAASMIAFGAGCSFGDQLHPIGKMDLETYRNIGKAYAYVEQIEEFGIGGLPVSNLGVWLTGKQSADEGVVKMLLETQTDFVIVDSRNDLSSYTTIILTGAACLTEKDADQLNAFADTGGALLVLGESALDQKKEKFLLDVGADYLGPANFDEDFLLVGEELGRGLVTSPFLNYQAALRVQPNAGTDVLANLHEPYFNRTYATYCSHQNTPYRLEQAGHPGALRKGRVVLLPHSLGTLYYRHGARVHRDLFINALRLIYSNPLLKTEMPSCGRISLLHQAEQQRYVAHLLYAPVLSRGRCLVIEDLVPLHHIPVELCVPETIKNAYLIPNHQTLSWSYQDGVCKMILPEWQGHCAVVFEYEA